MIRAHKCFYARYIDENGKDVTLRLIIELLRYLFFSRNMKILVLD